MENSQDFAAFDSLDAISHQRDAISHCRRATISRAGSPQQEKVKLQHRNHVTQTE